ncbi:glycosyltransferase family 39 protein [Candidatus Woesearchaeota archaeon]|nr:glycosyltransferase family 39 protein [Candidatus Woesearchaeota archaeon]
MEELRKRKEEILAFLGLDIDLKGMKDSLAKKSIAYKNILIWAVFAVIAWFGYQIRTKNLPLLQGRFLVGPDEYAFLRYVKSVVAQGFLMNVDLMRYYPTGFSGMSEFKVVTYVMVYFYKISHFFNPAVTVEDAVILYPAVAFVLGLVFFFLLVRELFDWKAALVASAFLSVLPAYLFRTLAGVSDKEAIGMAFFFMAFYFFVKAWKFPEEKKSFVFILLSGLSTGAMAASWGGVISVFLVLGLFLLLEIFLERMSLSKLFLIGFWLFTFLVLSNLFFPTRYTVGSFLTGTNTLFLNFAFLLGCVDLALQKWQPTFLQRFQKKVPRVFLSAIVALVGGLVLALALFDSSVLLGSLKLLFTQLTTPLGDRWAYTVAESHQPFFTDWASQFSNLFLVIVFLASVILFYRIVQRFGKKGKVMTAVFGLALLLTVISRYAYGTSLDGSTFLSKLFLAGSLGGLFLSLLYFYFAVYRDGDGPLFKEVSPMLLFALAWLVAMVFAARTAIRLLFIFAPAVAAMMGYFVMEFIGFAGKIRKDAIRIGAFLLVAVVLGNMFVQFSQAVTLQATYTGPGYDLQWYNGMEWVKANTPEDAVFAHWWDYGYWVQAGGERATLTDGGNAFGELNYFMGRNVLTGHSDEEALQFLKAKEASHLLIVSQEIGKYGAFSSIGSDANYDRYSWVPTFGLDPSLIRETRNETVYVYTGGTLLDHDFISKGKVYPGRSAAVGGFFVKVKDVVKRDENGTVVDERKEFYEPEVVLFYNGMQERVPVTCMYYDQKLVEREVEGGFDGCLYFMPVDFQPYQAVLYISPEVRKTNFARLYLFNEASPYFKLVYSDEAQVPIMLYSGRQFGPMKIWEVSYPDGLEVPEYYSKHEYPDPNVTIATLV